MTAFPSFPETVKELVLDSTSLKERVAVLEAGSGGGGAPTPNIRILEDGGMFTLTEEDADGIVIFASPNQSSFSVADAIIPIGSRVILFRAGSGTVEVACDDANINGSSGSRNIEQIQGVMELTYIGDQEYLITSPGYAGPVPQKFRLMDEPSGSIIPNDKNGTVFTTRASAHVIILDGSNIPTGYDVTVSRIGNGVPSITPTGGATINGTVDPVTLDTIYDSVTIFAVGARDYVIVRQTKAVAPV